MTVMNTLPDVIPKHDDGMLDLQELGETLAETLDNKNNTVLSAVTKIYDATGISIKKIRESSSKTRC